MSDRELSWALPCLFRRILREYTDGMVEEVCTDLKQWLEQLATVLSLGRQEFIAVFWVLWQVPRLSDSIVHWPSFWMSESHLLWGLSTIFIFWTRKMDIVIWLEGLTFSRPSSRTAKATKRTYILTCMHACRTCVYIYIYIQLYTQYIFNYCIYIYTRASMAMDRERYL